MLPAIAIALFLLAILISAYHAQSIESQKDRAVMQHTIDVNLEILQSELVALHEVAAHTPPGSAREQALTLLKEAQIIAAAVRARQPEASHEELGELLGAAFSAMNKSTEARRLLNACKPL
jgi:hypothetical protein